MKLTRGIFVVALVLLGCELAAVAWRMTRPPIEGRMLTLLLPTDGTEGFEEGDFDETPAAKLLSPDRVVIGSWPKSNLHVQYFEYLPGNASWWGDLFMHKPEACMGHRGATLMEKTPPQELEVGGQKLKVQLYFFKTAKGQPLCAFKSVWVFPEIIGKTGAHPWALRSRNALTTGSGPAARMILASIPTADKELAWQLLHTELLSKIVFTKM